MTRKKVPNRNKAATASAQNPQGKTPAPTHQKKPFGRQLADFLPLLPAEQELLNAVAIGEMCWLCDENNPVRPKEKTKDNETRADFIRFLALGGDDDVFVHETGICLAGAYIQNELNLISCNVSSGLIIIYTAFQNKLSFTQCSINNLNLSSSSFDHLEASHISLKSNLILKDVVCEFIHLKNATIIGSLYLQGAKLRGYDSLDTLNCDSLTAEGYIFLSHHFKATGTISFIGAIIRKDFICINSTFNNPNNIALNCQAIVIDGSLFMRRPFNSETQHSACVSLRRPHVVSCSPGFFLACG